MMNDSFTRSLYIGRDKAIEVARRREAVEKQLKERREAKIREQQERISRAAQHKEQELKVKVRQRQERELQRQRAVIDRRCAQLEQDKAKKAEILQKAHNSASRPAQVNRKNAYAFGCSTPRVATYLETPRNYITKEFSASSERVGDTRMAARIATAAMRTPSRIMAGPSAATPKSQQGTGAPPPSMTRSVFGRLGNSRPLCPPATTETMAGSRGGRRTTNTSANSSSGESAASLAITRRTTPSIMTQSLYEGKRNSTPVKKSQPRTTLTRPAAKLPARNPTLNKVSRSLPAQEVATDLSPVNRPPPIQLRKIMQVADAETNKTDVTNDVTSLKTKLESVSLAVESNDKPTAIVQQSMELNAIESGNSTIVVKQAIHPVMPKEPIEKGDDEAPMKSAVESEFNSSTNSSTGNLLMTGTKEEWDSGHESNCPNDAETAPKSKDSSDAFSLSTQKAGSVGGSDNHILTTTANDNDETKDVDDNDTATSAMPPATITTTTDDEYKDRESRRQKLLEILQRTRNSSNPPTPNNSSAPLGTSADNGNGGLPVLRPSGGVGIDATALAHDLLAQRRQKLQELAAVNTAPSVETKPISDADGPAVFTLNSQLNGAGLYENEDVTIVPVANSATTYASQRLNAVLNKNGNSNNDGSEHFRENTLVQMPGEVLSRIDLIRQHKQHAFPNDPEDPRMDGATDASLSASRAVIVKEVEVEEEEEGGDEEYYINLPSLTNLYQINFVNQMT